MPDEKLTYGHPDSAVVMPKEVSNAKEIQFLNQETYEDSDNYFLFHRSWQTNIGVILLIRRKWYRKVREKTMTADSIEL